MEKKHVKRVSVRCFKSADFQWRLFSLVSLEIFKIRNSKCQKNGRSDDRRECVSTRKQWKARKFRKSIKRSCTNSELLSVCMTGTCWQQVAARAHKEQQSVSSALDRVEMFYVINKLI